MNMKFKYGMDLIHEIEEKSILDYQLCIPQIYGCKTIQSASVSQIDMENNQICIKIDNQTINIVGDSWNRVYPAHILDVHLKTLEFNPCSSKFAYGSTVNEWEKLESNTTWKLRYNELKFSWTLTLVRTSAQDGNSCLQKDGLWAIHHLQHYMKHPNDMELTTQQ